MTSPHSKSTEADRDAVARNAYVLGGANCGCNSEELRNRALYPSFGEMFKEKLGKNKQNNHMIRWEV